MSSLGRSISRKAAHLLPWPKTYKHPKAGSFFKAIRRRRRANKIARASRRRNHG